MDIALIPLLGDVLPMNVGRNMTEFDDTDSRRQRQVFLIG
jgi:hypothetical protein